MTILKRHLEFLLVAGALVLGCGETTDDPARPAAGRPGSGTPVFAEHRFDESLKQGAKPAGMDCTAGGMGECESGVCLHTGTEPGKGYVCSKRCESLTDCPAEWRCAQAVPGSAARVCIPPAN